MNDATQRRMLMRFGAALSAFILMIPGLGTAHSTNPESSFMDNFTTLGPLPGADTADTYEIKNGSWSVRDVPANLNTSALGTRRVLWQDSTATSNLDNTGVNREPTVYVRGKRWRSFTAQVTAAIVTIATQNNGDPVAGSSVGLAFRAPVNGGIADQNNQYLFTSAVTGTVTGFPTGKGLTLFKRVGAGYYLLHTKTVSTWADFTKPHDYKVVVSGGRIMCYFDGRLVIDHTDIPSGDQPTTVDPLPGLPIDAGAVGLRTSGTKAWFDDLRIVGNDAYEGRAFALDMRASYGDPAQIRRGVDITLSNQLNALGQNRIDTGFVYEDHETFDYAVARSIDSPGGGPLAGVDLRTTGRGGTVTSAARLFGVNLVTNDPDMHVLVTLHAAMIETVASAGCSTVGSQLNITNGTLYVTIVDTVAGSSQTIGPFPLRSTYEPNTALVDLPGVLTIVMHHRIITSVPRRVEAAALKIVMPEGTQTLLQDQTINGQRVSATNATTQPAEITIGGVVAARYCDPT